MAEIRYRKAEQTLRKVQSKIDWNLKHINQMIDQKNDLDIQINDMTIETYKLKDVLAGLED